MSLVQQLASDLATLSSESKRRNSDIRYASDKSLEVLKTFQAVPDKTKDESAFLKSLAKNPDFINPFLLSCQSKNAKFTTIALQSLNRLILYKSLPVTKLNQIIDALLESTHSSIEIQLKILQLLPSFFQNYSLFISDESLSKLLLVCSSLQSSNRMGAVINTAQATFLQLINIVFEKVNEEDKTKVDGSDETEYHLVASDIHDTIKVGPCAYDAQRIVNDLCTLIEHHKPLFLKTNYITEDFGFELLESIIKNNKRLFLEHVELGHLLRIRVAPILLRFLSSSKEFTVMVRVSRLMSLLVKEEFDVLKVESEVTLSLLTHTLLKEASSPPWKKILSLEIFNSIMKDFNLTKKIFSEYDNNQEEERKKVMDDFFKACAAIVSDNKQLLNTGNTIQAPSSPQTPTATSSSTTSFKGKTPTTSSSSSVRQDLDENKQGLSVSKSSIKMPYIDSLDKVDPPQVSETYQLYLIFQILLNYSDGISKHALELAADKSKDAGSNVTLLFLTDNSFDVDTVESKKLKKEYNCVKGMITHNAQKLLFLFKSFMYSSLDSELFSRLIRSLQKLCHVSGILSINETRDDILTLFAVSTLKLSGKQGFQNKILSFGESIVGTISSTIGNAVSNISNTASYGGTTAPPQGSQYFQLYPRNINSRQVLCFRVLGSLAASLGAILDDKWDIIMVTIQWISYYIDGPSDLKVKEIPPISPNLNNADLSSIETTLKKLMDSINMQSPSVFKHIINSISTLSEKSFKTPLNNDQGYGHEPVNKSQTLEPCLYNKSFYVNKLTDVCQINPLKFLIESDENWIYIKQFYTKLSNDRNLEDDIRLSVTRSFDSVIKSTAEAGFSGDLKVTSPETIDMIHMETEKKVLNALHSFIESLSKLPVTNELLVANCEVEMQLQILNTLKSVIDRYGTDIKHYWNVVTAMLNSPFTMISNADSGVLQEKAVNENIISVLKSSFETLKVILDEILQAIPINQIQIIIDCLFNFVTQKFDLNISFNSISYFWLISDYLKEKVENTQQIDNSPHSNDKIDQLITSEEALIRYVTEQEKFDDEVDLYQSLWIYLVFKLSTTANDSRTQVRNGSIITFFNVIDSYGSQAPSWSVIYSIVLKPIVMNINPPPEIGSASELEQQEWAESFVHIVNGLSKLYSQYLNEFESPNQKEIVGFWNGLIDYFSKMIKLEFNWIDLNLQIFKCYDSVLKNFVGNTGLPKKLPDELLEHFYSFWSGIQISYNLSNDSLYQESLSAFIASFEPLFILLQPILTLNKFEHILTVFNSCIRYPILIGNIKDNSRTTNLQSQVLLSLSKLKFVDPKFESLLIQQLNLIVILPFSTKDLIHKKLGDRGIRIPTFIAASYEAMGLLEKHLDSIPNYVPFLNDMCVLKVYKALLEPSKAKSDAFKFKGEHYLWMESSKILTKLTVKLCEVLSDPAIDSHIKPDIKEQLWSLILDTFKTCFVYSNDPESAFEEFDTKQYEVLKNSLVPVFTRNAAVSNMIMEEFIVTVWTSSFLYKLDEVENTILSTSKSPMEVSKRLSEFDFDVTFGSTSEIEKLPRLKLSKTCLNDLIQFSIPIKNNILSEKTLAYFISRCSFVLRKFLSDEKLLNKGPLPRIQQLEIKLILEGLVSILNALADFDTAESNAVYLKLVILYPLLVKSISVDSKVKGVPELIRTICMNFGKNVMELY
ncbi:hypothetical protein CANARDRAFT_29953 [[Candida] arabinofermentans NRRL YB-2248]|uniref:Protein MON2 homolog n=1 Tax=[Candida] arabinofermentans NRRL YB-2248 TaxID=983967 RepID=A0A1E4SVH1_9ASCO|nr:hypothetical protein CANARDRAFT_29953 [[Candida] arabinofermentans NRRL YB-2248]